MVARRGGRPLFKVGRSPFPPPALQKLALMVEYDGADNIHRWLIPAVSIHKSGKDGEIP